MCVVFMKIFVLECHNVFLVTKSTNFFTKRLFGNFVLKTNPSKFYLIWLYKLNHDWISRLLVLLLLVFFRERLWQWRNVFRDFFYKKINFEDVQLKCSFQINGARSRLTEILNVFGNKEDFTRDWLKYY